METVQGVGVSIAGGGELGTIPDPLPAACAETSAPGYTPRSTRPRVPL